jgi:diguanylate cyclase (GGDEF)-like protein/PAS domain S-box-containing protein
MESRLAKAALAVMTEAALLLDTQGDVLAANGLAGEMLGRRSAELAGCRVSSVLPLEELLRAFPPAAPPVRVQVEGVRANGVPFPVEATRVNDALCAMLGRAASDLLGRRDQELTHPDDRRADVDAAWEILDGRRGTHQCEKRFVRPDGSVVWALATLTFLRDASGRSLSWVGQFQDITERRRREALLQHMADHDPLTGLLNRRAFGRALEAHLAAVRERGADGALLLVDLDDFKRVNDERGHKAGDELLIACADALRRRLRDGDLVARLGGDEFAVLLPRAGRHGAEAASRAIVAAIGSGAVTASVGVVLITGASASADALLSGADHVMYVAKPAGGGDVRIAVT